MNIDTTHVQANELQDTRTTGDAADVRRQQAKLRQACHDFEGMMLSILLKESIKPSESLGEEGGQGNEILHDFAMEQVARQLGEDGTVGLGDLLYEQMSDYYAGGRHE